MPESLGLVLWIVAGLLMVTGAGAVLVFTYWGRPSFSLDEPAKVVRRPVPSAVKQVPVEVVDPKTLAARQAAYRLGLFVLIGLAFLTAAEFLVALLLEGTVALLFILILAKAGVIIQYYMHLDHVWEGEAHS